MVSTQAKMVTSYKKDTATHAPLPQGHAAILVSGCRKCHSLSLILDDSINNSCARCEQVDDLLCMVAELQDDIEMLWSIRGSEEEIDSWSHTLPPLRQVHQEEEKDSPLPFYHQASNNKKEDEERQKQVPAWGCRYPTSIPPPHTFLVHLQNRYRGEWRWRPESIQWVTQGLSLAPTP